MSSNLTKAEPVSENEHELRMKVISLELKLYELRTKNQNGSKAYRELSNKYEALKKLSLEAVELLETPCPCIHP
jgi:hypothetical protein